MSRDARALRRVGALLLAALAVAAFAIFMIGDRQNLFRRKVHYFVKFDTVGGLQEGSQVQLNGVNVGTVYDIVLPRDMGESQLEVWMSVDARFAQRIRQDSMVRIKTLGLLGDKYIDVTSGSPDHPEIPPDGEIQAAPSTDVDRLAAAGEDVMNNVVSISHQLATILARMERGEGLLGELTSNGEPGQRKVTVEILGAVEDLRGLIQKLETGRGTLPRLISDPTLADKLEGSATHLETVLSQAESGQGMLPALLNDPATKERLDHLLDRLDQVGNDLAQVTAGLKEQQALLPKLLLDKDYGREVAGELHELVKSLSSVAAKLDHGEGSVGKLINDPAFYQSLHEIVVGVNDSKFLSWLIRNRHKAGIEKRIQELESATPPAERKPGE